MPARTAFVIDTGALRDVDRRRAARVVLELVAPDVETFECDVPWSQQQGWPDEVREAAERLGALRSTRRSSDVYWQTGVIRRTDDSTWRAFVTFAPFAYDASASDMNGRRLVDLADEGTSLVARLDDNQARTVAEAFGHQVVVPLKAWRKRA
jgi:hypothetical protein